MGGANGTTSHSISVRGPGGVTVMALVTLAGDPAQVGYALNQAPNPGFETVSPFEWVGISGSTVTRNTAYQPNSGSASMRIDGPGGAGAAPSTTWVVNGVTQYQFSFFFNVPVGDQINQFAVDLQ